MVLAPDGDWSLLPDLSGEGVQTKDANGKIVIVHATTEAIHDYGKERVLDAASKKYAATPISPVKISTAYCSEA